MKFLVETDSKTLCHCPNIKPCTVVAYALSRTPIHLDDPSKDEEEEARAYAIHLHPDLNDLRKH